MPLVGLRFGPLGGCVVGWLGNNIHSISPRKACVQICAGRQLDSMIDENPMYVISWREGAATKKGRRRTASDLLVSLVGTTGFEPAASRSRKSSSGQRYALPFWPSSLFSVFDLQFCQHRPFPSSIVPSITGRAFVASLWPVGAVFCGHSRTPMSMEGRSL